MKRTTQIITAAGLAMSLALPASQAFAASHKTENALIGGALGALAGALIGNGDTGAVVAGAAAGAVIGTAATSDRQRWEDSQRRAYRTRYEQPYGAYQNGYGYQRNGYGYQTQDRYGDRRYVGYDGRRYDQNRYGYYGR